MNKIYRTKYNASLGIWVAVSEISRSHGKTGPLTHTGARGVPGLPRQLFRLFTALLTMGGLFTAGPVWASCSGAGGTYICSGVTTVNQTLTAPTLNVTADTTFQSTVSNADALSITASSGDLFFTQAAGSTITATMTGSSVVAKNNGTGTSILNIDGTLSGGTVGVSADSYGSALNITSGVTSNISGGGGLALVL
ncbi:ESPR domain-containing protein [Kosakonia oryziphila]|uniref:Extended Signal Peptide of Type V secretion system n=1 Tax=Kosakonia oryziphila TaxID=1005667 RepID=A0A1C4G626_9ENTR|nr:ESPR domain-containing protein [Kosakonia oryziphila]SCC63393.1 Extended Signal Peptide of Type V secretion system [Kosakonia oryziphila]